MRRQGIILVWTGIVFCLVGGCGQKGEKISGQPAVSEVEPPQAVWDGTPPATEAIPDFFADAPETNAFPESMVGVWEVVMNEEIGNKWGIKFEPDGSIEKIIHSLAGPVKIADGGVAAEGPDEGTYYIFTVLPCESRYMPDTNTIKVKIIVDYFIMKLPAGELEGRIEDYFEGPVSEEGKTWNVKWRDFTWLKDAMMPDINAIKANPEPLIFVKIDPVRQRGRVNTLLPAGSSSQE